MPLYGCLSVAEKEVANYAKELVSMTGTHSVDTVCRNIRRFKDLDNLDNCSNEVRIKIFNKFERFCFKNFAKGSVKRNFDLSDTMDRLVFELRRTRELPGPNAIKFEIKNEK